MAARMAQSFHRLHAAPRFLQDFNMFRLVESYLRIVDEHEVTIPDGYRDWLPTVTGIERAVSDGALPARPPSTPITRPRAVDRRSRGLIQPLRQLRRHLPMNGEDPCEIDSAPPSALPTPPHEWGGLAARLTPHRWGATFRAGISVAYRHLFKGWGQWRSPSRSRFGRKARRHISASSNASSAWRWRPARWSTRRGCARSS